MSEIEYDNKEIIEIEDNEEFLKLRSELAPYNYNLVDVAHIVDTESEENTIEKSAVAIVSAEEKTEYEDLMVELVDKAHEKMEWLNIHD